LEPAVSNTFSKIEKQIDEDSDNSVLEVIQSDGKYVKILNKKRVGNNSFLLINIKISFSVCK